MPPRTIRLARALPLLAAVGGAVLAGCDGEATQPASPPTPALTLQALAGPWTLKSVGGVALPMELVAGRPDSLISKVYSIGADGTYRLEARQRAFAAGRMQPLDWSDSGTVSLVGTAITLASRRYPNTIQRGSVAGRTMTLYLNESTVPQVLER